MARYDFFLTVVDELLTAVDSQSCEVLTRGSRHTWKKFIYSGDARPHFNFISYALLPNSIVTLKLSGI